MKLLRNPFVTGALAVVALLVVLYQFVGPTVFRGRPSAAKPSAAPARPASPTPAARSGRAAAATPTQPRKAAASPERAPNPLPVGEELLPDRPVEASLVATRFPTWVSAPLRDPFLLLQPIVEDAVLSLAETNSPVPTWNLQAIWHQTDIRLAVINARVWRLGDEREGYKLIRIEKDEVWFQGPHHHERLGFAEPRKAASLGKGGRAKTQKTKTQPKAKTTAKKT
jgi:hypothetical protein